MRGLWDAIPYYGYLSGSRAYCRWPVLNSCAAEDAKLSWLV